MKAYEETCNAAIKNLIDSLKDVNDVYALSVTAYALQLAQFASKGEVLLNLLNKAKTKGRIQSFEPINGQLIQFSLCV